MADATEIGAQPALKRLSPQAPANASGGVVRLGAAISTRKKKFPSGFAAIVGAPTLIAAIYFGLFATPQYVSEARFIVRAPSQTQPTGIGAIFQSMGGGAPNDVFSVHNYVVSRDATRRLEQEQNLRAVLGPRGVDIFSRFPQPWEGRTFEQLHKAYLRHVTVGYDSSTGMSTLRVTTFRAGDSARLANALLAQGEQLINKLNERSKADALADAGREVAIAEQRITDVQARITAFRNREQMIDPGRQSASNLEIVNRLAGELALARAQRGEIAAAAPESPQLPALDRRIEALRRQIEVEQAKVAGPQDSLAPKISDFERLTLERQFADRALASATSSLETARLEAQRKQLYLERVVEPNTPDYPTRPQRLLNVAVVFTTALAAYGAIMLLIAGLRERRQI